MDRFDSMSLQVLIERLASCFCCAGKVFCTILSLAAFLLVAIPDGEAASSDGRLDSSQGEDQPLMAAEEAVSCSRHAECSDGNACNGLEICSEGICSRGQRLACLPRNACFFAICDPRTGCKERPVSGGSCDDGNMCTSGDTCQEGACVSGSAIFCEDQGPCVVGICDPDSGCATKILRDGSACDDGRRDTKNESCRAGRCRGERIDPTILEQEIEDKLFDLEQDEDQDPI